MTELAPAKCRHGRVLGQGCEHCYRANNCRWCRDGNVANEKGKHWIVKSIIPAKIDIRECTAVGHAHGEKDQSR